MSESGLCHMCLGSNLEIIDTDNHLCVQCFAKYHKYKKTSPENEAAKTYTMKDLKKKWERK